MTRPSSMHAARPLPAPGMKRARTMVAYLVACLFALGLVAVIALDLVRGAYGATNAPNTSAQATALGTYYPPLLNLYGVSQLIEHSGNSWQYNIRLMYGGGLSGIYKQLKPRDTIPAVRVQLVLPAGMVLTKYQVIVSGWLADGHKGRPPLKDRTVRIVGGKPTWVFYGLDEGLGPLARFWLSVPDGQSQRCFSAEAAGMTLYRKKWVRIPHAPLQTAQACIPAPSGTSTTP